MHVNDKLRPIRRGQLICAQFGRVLGEDRSGKQCKEQQEGAQQQLQSTVGYR